MMLADAPTGDDVGSAHLGETRRMAAVAGLLDQHRLHRPDQCREPRRLPPRRRRAQPRGPLAPRSERHLRHPRRRACRRAPNRGRHAHGRCRSRRSAPACSRTSRRSRSGSPRSGPRRSRRRARAFSRSTSAHRVGARVAALHPLEDQVVARLQRQMEVRHHPRLAARPARTARSSISIESSDDSRSRSSAGTARRIASTSVPSSARPAGRGRSWSGRRRSAPPRDARPRPAPRCARSPRRPAPTGWRRVRRGWCRRCSDGRSRSAPRRTRAHGREAAARCGAVSRARHVALTAGRAPAGSSFSALPITRSTSGIAAKAAGSIFAAQPVTTSSRAGSRAARAADRGAGLLDRLVGHRAAVDDDRVAAAEQRADRFALGDVEAAAERDDVGLRGGPAWRAI